MVARSPDLLLRPPVDRPPRDEPPVLVSFAAEPAELHCPLDLPDDPDRQQEHKVLAASTPWIFNAAAPDVYPATGTPIIGAGNFGEHLVHDPVGDGPVHAEAFEVQTPAVQFHVTPVHADALAVTPAAMQAHQMPVLYALSLPDLSKLRDMFWLLREKTGCYWP